MLPSFAQKTSFLAALIVSTAICVAAEAEPTLDAQQQAALWTNPVVASGQVVRSDVFRTNEDQYGSYNTAYGAYEIAGLSLNVDAPVYQTTLPSSLQPSVPGTFEVAEANIDEYDDALFMSDSVGNEELSRYRGGAMSFSSEVLGVAVFNATAARNVAVGSSGTNTISEGVFDGAQGVVSVVQNVGNNVVIQQATIVNLVQRP